MLKQLLNHARIELTIDVVDPMLIKSGQATVGGVDMSFVRTYRDGKAAPFIPGSSLKGVIRSHVEKICRSLRPDAVPVCLPYVDPERSDSPVEREQASCGLRISRSPANETITSWDAYRYSCPACRLFGSLAFTGRFATSDGSIEEGYVTEVRDGVGIDRTTGGAAGGVKYDLEVLSKGTFKTVLEIRNFEKWQVALLALVLRDMEEELARIGSGKSRGLGKFKGTVNRFELSYSNETPKTFIGLWNQATEQDRNRYGLVAESGESAPLPGPVRRGLRQNYDITENWREILESGLADLTGYIEEVQWPRELSEHISTHGAR